MSEKNNIHEGHRQRLKNRFLQEGLENFNEINVLEFMLFYCVQRKDTNPLAHRLLNEFGSLPNVLDAPFQDLIRIEGVTEHVATYLKMQSELNRYCMMRRANENQILSTTEACGKYLVPRFVGLQQEVVYLLCLDAKCKVLCCKKVEEGGITSANISARKMIALALSYNAVSVVLAHNHPSGLAIPSIEDIQATAQIGEALAVSGIILADHLVVADNDYVSMVQSGQYNPSWKGRRRL